MKFRFTFLFLIALQQFTFASTHSFSYSNYAPFDSTHAHKWRPNILVIYLDDSRWDVYQPNGGYPFFNTPGINRIANEGVNFKYCFPATSVCSPSRASIMSGLYTHHHGVYGNFRVDTFPFITVAQILHDHGYYTGFIGKYDYERFPIPGYDYYLESSSHEYINAFYDYNGAMDTMITGHKSDVLTAGTIDFLNSVPSGKRFLLFLAHKAPHVPYEPRPQDVGMFDADSIPVPPDFFPYTHDIPSHYYECNNSNLGGVIPFEINYQRYFEMIEGASQGIDTVMAYLDAHNLTDSTLIIFTSDNGLFMGEHMIGGKELALDESIRLPMFIRYPKWFAAGTVITDEMAMNIDIAPTIIQAANVPGTYDFDGVSMKKLADHELNRKELFYEFFQRHGSCNPTTLSVRSFQYKYVWNECANFSEEFYDLVNDSLEDNNLIADASYDSLIQVYRWKLDSLEIATDFVNIRDTVLNCRLDSSDIIITNDDEVSPSSAPSIFLFPNPVGGQLFFSFHTLPDDDISISVSNIFSEIVLQKRFSASSFHSQEIIDCTDLPAGIYFLRVNDASHMMVEPFVKE